MYLELSIPLLQVDLYVLFPLVWMGVGKFGQVWAKLGKSGQVWMGQTDRAGMGYMGGGWVWLYVQI